MSGRLLEKCPYCNQGLSVALNRYFWSHIPEGCFDYECPNCHEVMSVEVESEPTFWVSKVSRPTPRAVDGLVCTCHQFTPLQYNPRKCGFCGKPPATNA